MHISRYAIAPLALIAVMALLLTGCDGSSASTTEDDDAPSATTATTPPDDEDGSASDAEPGSADPTDVTGVSSDVELPAGVDAPDDLIELAVIAWLDKVETGADLSDGPCLGIIAPDWVADIAHNPRTDVDNDRANQCDEFHAGEATNFIELTEDGVPFNVNGQPISIDTGTD